jgi:hypothetical protein
MMNTRVLLLVTGLGLSLPVACSLSFAEPPQGKFAMEARYPAVWGSGSRRIELRVGLTRAGEVDISTNPGRRVR